MLELYNILKNDQQLSTLLGASLTDSKIYPYKNENGDKCITYNYITLTSDKIKEQVRYEVRVFVIDILEGQQILKRVKDILLTLGDNQLTNEIIEVNVNGGITPLFDKDTGLYTIGLFFSLIKKY